MQVTEDDVHQLARILHGDLYEASFRGKSRGRFALTRAQMKQALGVRKLHTSTVERLQDHALAIGLVIVDLDDLFACVEVDVLRKYRRPPRAVFNRFFAPIEEPRQSAEFDGEGE
jgi:hypothetical protein